MTLRLLIILFSFLSFSLFSQNPETIRVKRNNDLIYFFQKGAGSDTITKAKGTVFYLLVPDSLKEAVSIQSENGQLLPEANDSLVKFKFLKGIKYELLYKPENEAGLKGKIILQSHINGAVDNPGNIVIIKIIDKRKSTQLLESRFFYKE